MRKKVKYISLSIMFLSILLITPRTFAAAEQSNTREAVGNVKEISPDRILTKKIPRKMLTSKYYLIWNRYKKVPLS